MHTGLLRRYLTVATTALVLLAAVASTASARSFSSSVQTFRSMWTRLEFTNELGFGTLSCAITLEGSFHSRTIAKTAELVGAVTRVDIRRPCTNGEAVARTETLPWHVTYSGFIGNLPNITGIILLLSRLRIAITLPGECDGEYGSATDNIRSTATREAGGGMTTVEPSNDRTTLIRTNSGFCPSRGGFGGNATVTALNSASRITLTLI